MKYLIKHIIIVFLLISLASCDVASGLLTTNHFEQFKDYNPFTLVIGEITWAMLTEEQQLEKINEYTNAALSDDNSDDFFDMLSENKDYRDDVTDHYRGLLDVVPDDESETYLVDLALYQRRAMALGLIEVYTRTASAVSGFETLLYSYLEGTGEMLSPTLFITEVFQIPEPSAMTETEIKAQLKDDLIGAYNAGEAFNDLGITIEDTDNPSAEVVTGGDGVVILLSCMMYRIINLNIPGSEDPLSDTIFDTLTDYIYDNDDSATAILFPQTETASVDDTILEHYLGEGGALIYTATGYELPPITDLGGSEL